MSDIAINVNNISKRYRIGLKEKTNDTFVGAIGSIFKSPFENFKRLKNLTYFKSELEAPDEIIWALKNITFEVKMGEVIGIIGANGAGKSTLLKILAQITHPSTGRVELNGRVASLLEVGTGFHPELTGRENIYLNGTILGMKKYEIDYKLDEIVEFSGIEKFLDTPVKRYSSGMGVRLAFSVAAHLEPEILLIDEVLAVGDADFQKKCLGKMDEVSKGGRTVLFVSHNLAMINRICDRGILLKNGYEIKTGNINEVINKYISEIKSNNAVINYEHDKSKIIQIKRTLLLNHDDNPSLELDRTKPFRVSIHYDVNEDVSGSIIAVMLDKVDRTPVCHTTDVDNTSGFKIDRKIGSYESIVEFPGGLLNAGAYSIRIGISKKGQEIFDYKEPFHFNLLDFGTFAGIYGKNGGQRLGIIAPNLFWECSKK